MLSPPPTFVDPAFEQTHLIGRQLLSRVRRRHHLVRVAAAEATNDFTLFGFARHDGHLATLAGTEGSFLKIQPKPTLATSRRGTVALVAVLRKDGLDVPGEIDVDGTQPDSGHQSDAQRTPKPRNGSHGDHDNECGVLFNAGDGNL